MSQFLNKLRGLKHLICPCNLKSKVFPRYFMGTHLPKFMDHHLTSELQYSEGSEKILRTRTIWRIPTAISENGNIVEVEDQNNGRTGWRVCCPRETRCRTSGRIFFKTSFTASRGKVGWSSGLMPRGEIPLLPRRYTMGDGPQAGLTQLAWENMTCLTFLATYTANFLLCARPP